MKRYVRRLFLLLACTMILAIVPNGLAYAAEESIYTIDITNMKASEMLEKIPHTIENEKYEKIAVDCLKAMEQYKGKGDSIQVGIYSIPTNEIQGISDYLCYSGIIDPRMTLVARIGNNGNIKLEIAIEDDDDRKSILDLPDEYKKSMLKVQELCKAASSYNDREKVRFYHDWIKDNTVPGEAKGRQYTMYGVFYEKQAASQGYAIAMNQLCRYSNISSRVESFPQYSQSSNVITLNETEYYLDVRADDETGSNKFYLIDRDTILKLYKQYF